MAPRARPSATYEAPPNIALVKYWGVRDPALALPYNSSLSVTLDRLRSRTTVRFDPELDEDWVVLNGTPSDRGTAGGGGPIPRPRPGPSRDPESCPGPLREQLSDRERSRLERERFRGARGGGDARGRPHPLRPRALAARPVRLGQRVPLGLRWVRRMASGGAPRRPGLLRPPPLRARPLARDRRPGPPRPRCPGQGRPLGRRDAIDRSDERLLRRTPTGDPGADPTDPGRDRSPAGGPSLPADHGGVRQLPPRLRDDPSLPRLPHVHVARDPRRGSCPEPVGGPPGRQGTRTTRARTSMSSRSAGISSASAPVSRPSTGSSAPSRSRRAPAVGGSRHRGAARAKGRAGRIRGRGARGRCSPSSR